MENIIGENLKFIRKAIIRTTRLEFSKYLGISYNVLQNYEDGRTPLDPDVDAALLREIEHKCGLPPSSLEDRLLTKQDVPVIVSKHSDAEVDRLRKEMALLKKELAKLKSLVVNKPQKRKSVNG